MDKNMHFAILKRFTKHKKVLLNCLIIIFLMVSKKKYETVQLRGIKVLTPKQMLAILTVVISQV